MREHEVKKYRQLNELSKPGGIVIFGCGSDKSIPTCELRQAFTIVPDLYNRSFETMSVNEAADIYEEVIAPLAPQTVLIHIGECDKALLSECSVEFDNRFRELIRRIKTQNKKCQIAIVSFKNPDNEPQTEALNRHLKCIADSERCFYGDITTQKVWNPRVTMEAASFIYSLGLVTQPLYDLVRMLFYCDAK